MYMIDDATIAINPSELYAGEAKLDDAAHLVVIRLQFS